MYTCKQLCIVNFIFCLVACTYAHTCCITVITWEPDIHTRSLRTANQMAMATYTSGRPRVPELKLF